MGQRTTGETICAILVAFLHHRTWKQVELAKHCDISVKALRTRLQELSRHGVPLHTDNDHPHVFWSVPKDWYPNGTLLEPHEVALIARLLSRLPATADRKRAVRIVLGADDGVELDPGEDAERSLVLATIEDAARECRVVSIDYYTASRGDRGVRDVSIHSVLHRERSRIVATCHRTGTLKFFRIDRIQTAKACAGVEFRKASQSEIEAFIDSSVDGYRGPGDAVACTFFVRHPDARWVSRNLPRGPISALHVADGVRFATRTAGLDALARFVVSLGAAARAETPELKRRVEELALGALQQLKPVRKVNTKSVRLKQATE